MGDAQSPSQVTPRLAFRSVWFDCDSTLSAIEGIDELAALRDEGIRGEIVRLTERAMAGEIALEAVYGLRLARIAPTRDECDRIGALYVERVLPDAARVIAALGVLGKSVGIVSGGLLPPVMRLATALGVARERVLAVGIAFGSDGRYAGFDASSPLARSGGKPIVLAARPSVERPLAMVGDGSTDLETASVVDRFVGFGGVARRAAVVAGATCFADGPGLSSTLPFLLTREEQDTLRRDPRFASLLLE